MAFQYDINKIFAELEQQAQKNKGQHALISGLGSSSLATRTKMC
mgnify:CR=1 FL=1